jgi:hypothetical protein
MLSLFKHFGRQRFQNGLKQTAKTLAPIAEKMKPTIIILLLTMFFGCADTADTQPRKAFPIDPKELSLKKGDCFAFSIDSNNYSIAIIFDYQKDEGGLWYSLLYTNYHSDTILQNPSLTDVNVFGRKVTSTLNDKGYELLLDGEYISDSLINVEKHFKYVGNISLNEKTTRLGAYGASTDFPSFLNSFRFAIKQRSVDKKEDKIIKLLYPKNSEGYYPLADFTK